jgi:hypothetical protein
MDVQRILQQASLLLTALINALLKLSECLNGMLMNGSDLREESVFSACRDLHTKQKRYSYPLKQISENCVSFKGNVKSLNLKTGTITTTQYKAKNKCSTF